MVPEARLEQRESGLAPATEGWFVVNVRDTRWDTHETFGGNCSTVVGRLTIIFRSGVGPHSAATASQISSA